MPRNGRLRLGLVTYLVGKDLDLESLITLCEKTGLEGLELRTTHAHGVELSLTPAERERVRKRFEATPVVLAVLGSICEYHSPDAAVVRRNVEETKRWLHLAHDVGALGVKVRPNGLPEGVPVEKTLSEIAGAIAECGDAAESVGKDIFIEVHGGGTSDPPRMKAILDACPSPRIGATWNCNPTDLEDGSIEWTYRLLSPRVRMAHIHDLYEGYPYKQELFPAMLRDSFGGYCLIEMAQTADPERVLRYYRRLFDEMVEACA